ncbi:MAG TPA: hypothetical protein VFQ59_03540 [Candidatus Paceibacterota bacterium]|nr:hypothetical protein [Candidatus Paceibacterota bacterium]
MFNNSHTGISFSDGMIYFTKLKKTFSGFELAGYGQKELPSGLFENGKIKDKEELVKVLRALRAEQNIRSAFVAVPTDDEGLIENFEEAFNLAGITIKEIETEGEAIFRSVVPVESYDEYMIVNIRNSTTGIYIVADRKVAFETNINIGGDTIMKITEEKTTHERGLDREVVTSMISSAVMTGVQILREEVNKYFVRWHTRRDATDPERPMINKVILCGDASYLKGLDEYFTVTLKTNTEFANVWMNILEPSKKIPELTYKESLSFAGALGAALKGFK